MADIKQSLYLFDFDGTLTRRDTLIAIIRYAKGRVGLLWQLLRVAPWVVLMKLHLYNNGKAKQRLFAHCFGGMTLEGFDALCRRFSRENKAVLLRRDTMSVLRRAQAEGARVMVVSASIDNWVRPFFEGGQEPEVVGTQVEVADDRLTGRFLTPNCYGQEKVRRVEELVPDLVSHRSQYDITAYGDSRGDKEMIAYADEGHYVG